MPEHSGDAVVVGAGPNGLAAAITLARAGRSGRWCCEAARRSAAAARSAELTLPGFVHDICSAVHRSASASPFFREPAAGRARPGVDPPAGCRSPIRFDDGTRRRARALGRGDRRALGRGRAPPVRAAAWRRSSATGRCAHGTTCWRRCALPRHPLVLARFGLPRSGSAAGWPRARFRGEPRARAVRRAGGALDAAAASAASSAAVRVDAGCCGHARRLAGLPRGGSQRIADALASLPALARRRDRHRQLGAIARRAAARRRRAVRCHAAPAAADRRRPPARRATAGASALPLRPGRLQGGLGARWADPVAAPRPARAGTVHLGGTLDEIAASEAGGLDGRAPRAAVRAAGPAEPLRSDARAGGQAHRLGLLPRAERLDGRHDRAHRGAGRALRPRLSRPDPRAPAMGPAAMERATPTTSAATSTAACRTCASCSRARRAAWSLLDADRRCLHLLVGNAAGGGVHGMCGYYAARAALRRS